MYSDKRDWHTYLSWRDMMRRCYVPTMKEYPYYGGRGISVCNRWHTLKNFMQDMGRKQKGMTIERIDNDRGYSPDNCKWATRAEQRRNTKQNRWITHNGITLCVTDWARSLGCSPTAIFHRLASGWSTDDAVSIKAKGHS